MCHNVKKIPSVMAQSKRYKFSEIRRKAGLSIKECSALLQYNPRTLYRWEKGESVPRQLLLKTIQQAVTEATPNYISKRSDFTFIDLFAGIGGMRLGFESVGGKCIYTSEWNTYCQQTYIRNFGSHHQIAGDITKVHEAEIPAHDVLLAGFPCQPFSIAGVSKKKSLGQPHGFLCKTQGTLFHDVARIIAWHRPKAFLLENVKNLTSHDGGKTFAVIISTLEKLGYFISWKVIDARFFVPQHRERIFIAGFIKDTEFDLEKIRLPDQQPKLVSILHPENGGEAAEEPFTVGKKAKVNSKYTLTPKLWKYLQDYAAKHKAQGNGFGFGLFGPNDVARTLSARYYKDGSEILIRTRTGTPRRLTPRECARLMGFDRKGWPLFKIPVSDTQAYKQFGNSVAVPVVEAVANHMRPHIIRLVRGKKSGSNRKMLTERKESLLAI